MEHFGDEGALDLDGAFGTELLATEATDAFISFNDRLFVFEIFLVGTQKLVKCHNIPHKTLYNAYMIAYMCKIFNKSIEN